MAHEEGQGGFIKKPFLNGLRQRVVGYLNSTAGAPMSEQIDASSVDMSLQSVREIIPQSTQVPSHRQRKLEWYATRGQVSEDNGLGKRRHRLDTAPITAAPEQSVHIVGETERVIAHPFIVTPRLRDDIAGLSPVAKKEVREGLEAIMLGKGVYHPLTDIPGGIPLATGHAHKGGADHFRIIFMPKKGESGVLYAAAVVRRSKNYSPHVIRGLLQTVGMIAGWEKDGSLQDMQNLNSLSEIFT